MPLYAAPDTQYGYKSIYPAGIFENFHLSELLGIAPGKKTAVVYQVILAGYRLHLTQRLQRKTLYALFIHDPLTVNTTLRIIFR